MHVLQPFTDLAYEQHRVQLCQVVVLVNDAVEQLPSFHTTAQSHTHNYSNGQMRTHALLQIDRLTIP